MSLRTRLGIDVDADTRGVTTNMGRAGASVAKVGRIGRTAALGLAAALTAAAAAGGALASSAAEDDLAARRLEFQVQRVTDATDRQVDSLERWVTAQGKALGVTDDELRPALSRLVAATHDVGKAQDLASLAMDVSAGTGKSLETITMSLVRAQNGSVSGLSRLGVQTKNTAGETLSLEQVTKKLSDTYSGSAAAAADTAAGRYGRLKVQMGELGEQLGSKVLPYASKLGNFLLDNIPRVERFARQVGRTLSPALARVGGFLRDDVVPAARGFYEWFVDKIAPGLKRTVTPILSGLRKAFAYIADAVRDNKEEFKKAGEYVANDLGPALGDLAEDVLPVLGKGIGIIIRALGWLIDKFILAKEWCDKLITAIEGIDFKGAVGGGALDFATDTIPGLGGFLGRPVLPQLSPEAATSSGKSSFVDASVNVRIDGTGIVDERAVAQALAPILERHRTRIGGLAVMPA
jgi:hypothetical protein